MSKQIEEIVQPVEIRVSLAETRIEMLFSKFDELCYRVEYLENLVSLFSKENNDEKI